MSHLGARTCAAVLSGSLVFAGAAGGAMAQDEVGSKAAEERGRVGAVDLSKQSRAQKAEVPAPARQQLPVAAEVKARMVTGTVTAIDREERIVVLRDELSGEEITVLIPADAKTFDQLKVGDIVDVNMLQPLELAPPSE